MTKTKGDYKIMNSNTLIKGDLVAIDKDRQRVGEQISGYGTITRINVEEMKGTADVYWLDTGNISTHYLSSLRLVSRY